MIITIDGPTASGKSTVARELARRLGFYYLNTGMLYRAIAYVLMHYRNYSLSDVFQPQLDDLDYCLDPQKLAYYYEPSGTINIRFEGVDITPFLKHNSMDKASSTISVHPEVRSRLLEFQRWYGKKHDIVAEGRDLGTVVFPQAEVKFFLTASLEMRARRWQSDQKKYGEQFTLNQSEHEIAARDKRDQERTISPLKIPYGALVIDNTAYTIEQTVEHMMQQVGKKKEQP